MTDRPQLKLYNSLTRKKEDFVPRDPKRVTMYNCGPTVYSYAHIGNARAAVVADVLFRVLRYIYGEDHVVYARNITDVDDKIIAAANEACVPISDITEKYARIYNEDLAALGCLPPTHQPKATEHITQMIDMISGLIEGGYAYESDGHVFFDVSKYDAYGKLSGNTLDALKKGDRVGEGEVARKRNSADFVLWKPELDGVGWDAPFGKGRPGWHIECSVMAKATLCDEDYGNVIDIHCGGVDLKFPHHENERAQSCCANHTEEFANYWVHNEFLQMGSEKMSKSLGNVKLIHDLLKDWDGEVIRLALLKAHYRSELVWSEDLLKESKAQLDGWYRSIQISKIIVGGDIVPPYDAMLRSLFDDLASPLFLTHLENFRTSQKGNWQILTFVVGKLLLDDMHELAIEALNEKGDAGSMFAFINTANILGLLQKNPDNWFGKGVTDAHRQLAKDYDAIRTQALEAKAAGDKAEMGRLFGEADKLRDQLTADGVVIETKDGVSTLRRA